MRPQLCFSTSTINLPQMSLKFDMAKLSNLYFIFPLLIKLYEPGKCGLQRCALNNAITRPPTILCNLDNSSLNKVVRTMDNYFSSSQLLVKTFVSFVQNVCECSCSAILQNVHCSSQNIIHSL